MYPQSLAWMDAKSHYICLIFLPCVFSNDVPNCLHLWSITTHVALFHVGFSPECAVMVFYVLSQNVVRYHISTTQISNKMCWNYFSPECGVVLFKRAFKFTAKEDAMSHWLQLVWYVVKHFLFYGDQDKHVILQNWTSFHIFHKIPPQAGICSFGCTFGVRMPAKPHESPKTMPDALSRSRFWEIHIQKNMQDHARSCENVIYSSILIVTKESQVFNQFSCQTCGAVHFLF